MSRHFTALVLASIVASSACGIDLTAPSDDGEEQNLAVGLVPELAWLAGDWTFDTGRYYGGGSSYGSSLEPVAALTLAITSGGDATLTVGGVARQHRFQSGLGEGFCMCWTGTATYKLIRFAPELEFMNTRLGQYHVRDFTVRGGGDYLELRGQDTQLGGELQLTFQRR